jgi:hypothetical protein
MRQTFLIALVLAGAASPSMAAAQTADYSALAELMGEPVTTSVIGKPSGRPSSRPAL